MDENSDQAGAAEAILKKAIDSAEVVAALAGKVKADSDALQQVRASVEELAKAATALSTKAQADGDVVEQARMKVEKSRSQIAELLAQSTADTESCTKHSQDAKAVVEELKTLVTQLQERAAAATETSAHATAALESLRTLASTATESSARIEGLKTQVEQGAQVAAQRSEHIEEGRKYVDEKRKEIDVLMNTAQQSASGAEAQNQASRRTVEDLATVLANAQGAKALVDSIAQAIGTLREQCDGHVNTTKGLASMSQEVDAKVKGYEERLRELEATAAERLKTIESLLPGAAAAGLASAFGKRRENFLLPMRIWQFAFIASIAALIVIAWVEFGLYTKADATLTWDHLALMIVHRLPFMLPLIWLAYYASTKAALAQRVEEDYAFKETVSRSFEGYRKEMAELEGKAQPQSPLDRLCGGVLGVVTSPPGRIYEKHPLVPTPTVRSEPTAEKPQKEAKR
jgi:hypothetical protein